MSPRRQPGRGVAADGTGRGGHRTSGEGAGGGSRVQPGGRASARPTSRRAATTRPSPSLTRRWRPTRGTMQRSPTWRRPGGWGAWMQREAFERALKINPGLPPLSSTSRNVQLQEGRLNEAIEQYQRALHADPRSAVTHNNLALALMQVHQVRPGDRPLADRVGNQSGLFAGRENLAIAVAARGARVKARPPLPALSFEMKEGGHRLLFAGQRGLLPEGTEGWQGRPKGPCTCRHRVVSGREFHEASSAAGPSVWRKSLWDRG